jgi:hypothetical protein
MCLLSERMEPLEVEIDALSVASVGLFRATVLKDLRFNLPICHDESDLSDGNGNEVRLLWGALQLVGLEGFALQTQERLKAAIRSRRRGSRA